MPHESVQSPVLDTIAALTAVSLERSGLSPDELLLVRLAVLASTGAGSVSYLAHIGPAIDAGVTIERVQDVLVAIAPLVGTSRVMSAAVNIAEALGLVITLPEQKVA